MEDPNLKQIIMATSEQGGGSTVNRMLRTELAHILLKDRSLDLSSWLTEKQASYPIDREQLIGFSPAIAGARNENSGDASNSDDASDSGDAPDSGDATNSFDWSILTSDSGLIQNLKVMRPLHASILTWAEGAGLRSFPQRVTNKQLHDLLFKCDVIDLRPRAVVVGLTPLIALKVSQRSMIWYLETYEYIVWHAPTILVAKFLGVLTTDGFAYTFMQRVHGVRLDTIWGRLGQAEKDSIRQQLTEPFKLLRALRRPTSSLALGTGSPPRCIDMRQYVRVSAERITSESEFNRFLTEVDPSPLSPMLDMTLSYLREDHRIVMTHGDLRPGNIMVSGNERDKSIKVEAIMNWEASGMYPAYWEYVKALRTICVRDKTLDWYKFLPIDAIGVWGADYYIHRFIDSFF